MNILTQQELLQTARTYYLQAAAQAEKQLVELVKQQATLVPVPVTSDTPPVPATDRKRGRPGRKAKVKAHTMDTGKPARRARTMSVAGRERIKAAQRERWAKRRAEVTGAAASAIETTDTVTLNHFVPV